MADLVGNALKLIGMIMVTVETVQRNREQCQELGRFLRVLAGVLDQLPRKDLRPGTREALDVLEDTLQQAYKLVGSYQQPSSFLWFLTVQREAWQLREVQKRIESYLSLFPVINHVHLADHVTHLTNHVTHLASHVTHLSDQVSRLKFYIVIACSGFVFVGVVKVIRLFLLES